MDNLSNILSKKRISVVINKNIDEESPFQNVTRKINPNIQKITNSISRRL